MTASTADVALVAQAIDDELPLIGITASWSAAQAVIVALDKAQRLAPTPGVQRCGECDREILLGRLCQACRRAEDGPHEEREPLDDDAFAALMVTGYADDTAVF